ncbi:MICOS complex subunit MIC60 [Dissostichus eleginoides]|uniref:MICOS complex subunit MIC60 n=1 Tax=Dissostichus eleginoides TaxID=100907 RepID=A0AAD9CH89_DISEL|nr:MICOS complex subunit MIC60 [Dissostichus eleginoides]
MRPGGGKVPGLGSGPFQCQALSVSACCSSRGFHPLHNPGPSPPAVPTGPSKPDFPRRRASRGGPQPGTGGRQGRKGEAGEPASEPGKGVGL